VSAVAAPFFITVNVTVVLASGGMSRKLLIL